MEKRGGKNVSKNPVQENIAFKPAYTKKKKKKEKKQTNMCQEMVKKHSLWVQNPFYKLHL